MYSVSCNDANLPKDNKNKKMLLTSKSSDSQKDVPVIIGEKLGV